MQLQIKKLVVHGQIVDGFVAICDANLPSRCEFVDTCNQDVFYEIGSANGGEVFEAIKALTVDGSVTVDVNLIQDSQ